MLRSSKERLLSCERRRGGEPGGAKLKIMKKKKALKGSVTENERGRYREEDE